ncbi:MAG: hypothetical protein PHW85_04260 [Bacteroidales bacterium]|nr:hypothetical protein [Bacteroidales bacterium]MDD4420784.1 hypothetical protein [Bacteroidales bacterium]
MRRTAYHIKYPSLLVLLFITCISFSACNKTLSYDGQLSSFMANNAVGLYSMERSSFRYDSTDCQIVRNEFRKMIRMQKDDQSQLVNATFSTMYFGFEQPVNIKIAYVSPSYTSSFNMEAYLVQMQDGLYWLWDSNKKIGLIIPESE